MILFYMEDKFIDLSDLVFKLKVSFNELKVTKD